MSNCRQSINIRPMQHLINGMHWPENLHILIFIGLLFFISQIAGRLSSFFGGPRIIGYLLAGILFGPYCLSIFSKSLIENQLNILTEISLMIIAYSIGGALTIDKLRKVKKSIIWITNLQALGAFVVVVGSMALLLPVLLPSFSELGYQKAYLPIAMILGAVSVPTAPAAILSIVHELKAKGRFTTVILAVVALDDALAILIYGFVLTWVKILVVGRNISLTGSLIAPIMSITISVGVGLSVALIINLIIKYFAPRDVMLGFILGAILITGGLAQSLGVSPLLATMVFGFMIMNFAGHERAREAHNVIENIEEPLFGIFFLLAGAHLNIDMTITTMIITLILLFGRFLGKLLGSFLGASIAGSESSIKKYLGIGLLPSAGVTIGLVLNAKPTIDTISPQLGCILVSAILGKTLINELITPFFVRHVLIKAGDSKVSGKLKFAQPMNVHGRLGSLIAHRNHKK